MNKMEMVEKIRERADLTWEEARDLLDRHNWDMLDACVELEQTGKMTGSAKASTEKAAKETYDEVNPTVTGKSYEGGAAEKKERTGSKIRNGIRTLIRMGIDNKFVVNKGAETVLRIPVLPVVILLIAKFWLTAVVLLVGMVFGLRYSFEGKELGTETINQTMDKAAEAATDIVNNFTGKKETVKEEVKEDTVQTTVETPVAETVKETAEGNAEVKTEE